MQHEDDLILKLRQKGESWPRIADSLPGRTTDQVRNRFNNELDPNLQKKRAWTSVEDDILHSYQSELGNRWSDISKMLHGRSALDVKNRFYNNKNLSIRRTKKRSHHDPKSSV